MTLFRNPWIVALCGVLLGACTTAAGSGSGGGAPDGGFPVQDMGGHDQGGPLPDCPDGTPCNDGDLCTYNDLCLDGVCLGIPVDCLDEIPCTLDSCVNGTCRFDVAAGFCLIDDACWNTGQADPMDPAKVCEPALDPLGWSGGAVDACDDDGACDDGLACTDDGCVEGACQHLPLTGSGCDDGNACTWPDTCQAGACVSTPAVCPDTGDPCTASSCVAGACEVSPVAPGALCDDGDPCSVGETCVGGLCQGGTLKDADQDGAVDAACGGFDCDDGASWIGPGQTELCEDGIDNDCNDLVDGADGACMKGPTDPCVFHTDCYPWGVCGLWYADGSMRCSLPCAGSTDCPQSEVCSKLPGSAQVGYCQPQAAELPGAGAACGPSVLCEGGLCAANVCTEVCMGADHCMAPGSSCQPVGAPAAGVVTGGCMPNLPGGAPTGQSCIQGNAASGEYCATGHCDLMPPEGPWVCKTLCRREQDCAPLEECNVILYASITNPSSAPYDPQYTAPTTDAVTACYTPPVPGGNLAIGMPCTSPTQCGSYKCLALVPGDPTMVCTGYCTHDSDCPAGMLCKLDAVNMTSAWLQATDIGSMPPNLNVMSLVRLCKFE